VSDVGQSENQIARLIRMGVLSETAAKVPAALIGRLAALDDETATLEHRVRSYLDVNCAGCHNPRTRFAAFDARLDRDIGEQGLVDGTSHYHKDHGPDVRIVRPGDVERSMLHHRVATEDPSLRMPPLGTSIVDREAEELIAAWIRSLSPSDTPSESRPSGSPPPIADTPPQEQPPKTAAGNVELPK
jgi:mono/diheme cytochrome c family protein